RVRNHFARPACEDPSMNPALLQTLGVIASAGLGALATLAAIFNPADRRLKRLERLMALCESAQEMGFRTVANLETSVTMASQDVMIDVQVSRSHKSRIGTFIVVNIGALVSGGVGLWLLSDSPYFRAMVGLVAAMFAYSLVLVVLIERARTERAREVFRGELTRAEHEIIREMKRDDPSRAWAEGLVEGDAPAD
ncbi:hypothetical protein ACXET9_03770, partial [Brachybacterium sp. DNPG3]